MSFLLKVQTGYSLPYNQKRLSCSLSTSFWVSKVRAQLKCKVSSFNRKCLPGVRFSFTAALSWWQKWLALQGKSGREQVPGIVHKTGWKTEQLFEKLNNFFLLPFQRESGRCSLTLPNLFTEMYKVLFSWARVKPRNKREFSARFSKPLSVQQLFPQGHLLHAPLKALSPVLLPAPTSDSFIFSSSLPQMGKQPKNRVWENCSCF